ncbi:MAG: tape measure protein [Zoogloea sp.]|uniref:tape measure protein n=1 Tax=Zoogloea sp. TaxID=49181 RepID=UPI002620C8D9|nr:tape measure protein [Zoogloea sp.]MDD3325643.1 tape measure protein [Zoogloea sp.]
MSSLKALYLGLGLAGAASLDGLSDTADAYANLAARVKMAVGEGQAFEQAMASIKEIALNTGGSLEATAGLFTKLAEAGKQMGLGQAEALRLTETVNQAVRLSGASAQASEAALTQLIQGLQGGVLRGDEFNSVMEQAPRLAKALADGLGVTTGALRTMAEAGQLSSETVIRALQGQARAVETEFGKLPATIGGAITKLQTQWQAWIGDLDQSSGTSAQVAAGIEAIANNFDQLAAGLINAGQAWLGWKAYNIAAEMLSLKAAVASTAGATAAHTAATVANTAATTANTTATTANTAAKAASATAADAAAAGAGRLATALSMVKGLSLAFLVTNLKDIGEWMGTAAAKAMGYGKVIEENERQMKAAEKAAKEMAAADAEMAQQKQKAADAALGLSERSKKLVADFGDLTKKGETTAAALEKIGKDLDLSNIKGIAEAGAALDALAQRGKISAEQVQDAWEGALKDVDLQAFEVNARAAFDNTEQGARRLAAALEAQLGEALRRTGKDWGALAGGINDDAQTAINNFDVLARRVDDVRAKGLDAGIALAASLDQAAKAATTEKAVLAVKERFEQLGKQGLISGEQMREGLGKTREKLDELKPGINSLEEAYRKLGITSQEALQKTAEGAKEAYEYIKANGGAIKDQEAAWVKYAEAAKAAGWSVQSDIRALKEEMQDLGTTGVEAAEKTADAWEGATQSVRRFNDEAGKGEFSTNTRGEVITTGTDVQRLAAQNSTSPEGAKLFEELFTYYFNKEVADPQNRSSTMGVAYGAAEAKAIEAARAEAQRRAQQTSGSSSAKTNTASSNGNYWGTPRPVVMNVTISGRQSTFSASSQTDAEKIVRALQEALAAQS